MSDRDARVRDPLGKAALFSSAPPSEFHAPDGATRPATGPVASAEMDAVADQAAVAAAESGRGASHLFSRSDARPGTLVLDCSSCGRRTRVSYMEFAALHLPVWLWLPVPGRAHSHFMRCPSCARRTWLRARWLE